ncbi:uncharacterized protein TrAtP1_008503 [Trichoderma atroviride]|uniref:uncharacterized protein n=1 Tax=Hypocrea atroviridis TaxID=63577 RepID=UPI00332CE520|nr:hypothetical protein TrAtP1_008503 [Trichoderma atroviride]
MSVVPTLAEAAQDYLSCRISPASFHHRVSNAQRHLLGEQATDLPVIRRCKSHHPAWASSLALQCYAEPLFGELDMSMCGQQQAEYELSPKRACHASINGMYRLGEAK